MSSKYHLLGILSCGILSFAPAVGLAGDVCLTGAGSGIRRWQMVCKVMLALAAWAGATEWFFDPLAEAGGEGSAARPFATLAAAVAALPAGPDGPVTLHLAAGEARTNAWRLPPDTPPLRFNNTDPAMIDSRDNRALDQTQVDHEIRTWHKNHPLPTPGR